MKTHPLYLEDPYKKQVEATVLEASAEDKGGFRVILDRTVFYPRGGGQASDEGTFSFTDGSAAKVSLVLVKEDEIVHYIQAEKCPSPGDRVLGILDWDKRFKNMRLHTGGHIIDFALVMLGYCPKQLTPMKGDHSKKPHIVYEGTVNRDIQAELQKQVDDMIAKNLKFSWSIEPRAKLEMEAVYLQAGLPSNKPLRALRLESAGTVADGGTICASCREAGQVVISSIESDKRQTIIHYNCL